MVKDHLNRIARRALPTALVQWLRARVPGRSCPPVGRVRFGELRRITPISRRFGFDRGQPIDRYYIENFLARHAHDVRGRVLEIGDNTYTSRFGGNHVRTSDVLHVAEGNPSATIVADLAQGDSLPSNVFDCIIFTQTLHLIYDVRAAMLTLHRILRPGGVWLASFPGISQVDAGSWGTSWYWGLTIQSTRRLLKETFPSQDVTAESHGNVLAACAFLYGLAAEDLRREELDHHDPCYPVVITVRAVKSAAAP
jgi:SAM-dependent methyltransferase